MSKWSQVRSYHSVVAIDQGVSSLTNFIGVSMVARSVDADLFGVFSVLYLLSVGWLAVSRGWLSSRVSLLTDHEEVRRNSGMALAFSLLSALGVVATLQMLGVVVGAPVGLSAAIGVFTVAMVLQDELRFAAVALGRPGGALASDTLWLLVWGVAWVVSSSPTVALSALVVGPTVGLAVLLVRIPVRPILAGAWTYGLEKSAAASAQLMVALWGVGSSLAVTLVLAVAYSSEDAGGLQAAASVMSPPLLIVSMTYIGLTPWLSRQSRSRDLTAFVAIAVLGVVAMLAWWLLVVLVPAVGPLLVGDSWTAAQAFLAAVVLQRVAAALQSAANLVLRVQKRDFAILKQVGVAVAILTIMSAVVVVLHLDAVWLAWSLGVAWLASAALGSVVAVADARRTAQG